MEYCIKEERIGKKKKKKNREKNCCTGVIFFFFSFRSNVYGVERRVDVAFNKSDVTRGWKWKRAKHDGTRCFHLTRPEHRHRGERRENLWQFESYVIGWILFFFFPLHMSVWPKDSFFFLRRLRQFFDLRKWANNLVSFILSHCCVQYSFECIRDITLRK